MYCTYLLQGREEEGVGALSSESIFFHKRAHEYRRVDNKMPLNHQMSLQLSREHSRFHLLFSKSLLVYAPFWPHKASFRWVHIQMNFDLQELSHELRVDALYEVSDYVQVVGLTVVIGDGMYMRGMDTTALYMASHSL